MVRIRLPPAESPRTIGSARSWETDVRVKRERCFDPQSSTSVRRRPCLQIDGPDFLPDTGVRVV